MDQEWMSPKTKLEEMKKTQETVPIDLKQVDTTDQLHQQFVQQNSVASAKEEVAFIDQLLSGEYQEAELEKELTDAMQLKLTESDRMFLANRKTMDLVHILLNNHSKSDSKEMTAVKVDILNLAKEMERCSKLPPTPENLDCVEVAFQMAINSCSYYLDTKNPTFPKGKERKRQVQEVCMNLIYESEMFYGCRLALDSKEEGERPATIGDIVGMVKEADQTKERPLQKNEKFGPRNRNEMPKASETTNMVTAYFQPNYRFSDDLLAEGKDEKVRKAQALQVKDLYDTLKKFTPGRVEIADVTIMGKKVKLLQKSDGTAYIVDDHVEYALGKGLVTMQMQIEAETFAHPEAFSDEQIHAILDSYGTQGVRSSGENNRIRTVLISFLANKTGLINNDFNNTFRRDLAEYVRAILDGTKTGEQVKNEVVEKSRNAVFVNGVAISEMVEINANRSVDEIAEIVQMQEALHTRVEAEPGWTREEQQVKDMIADLIYTNDTEKMDTSINHPDEYVKDMLSRHKAAMDVLVGAKNGPEDMVKTILKKMSIGQLDGEIDGEKVNLSEVVTTAVNKLRDLYEEAGDGEIGAEKLTAIKQELDGVVDKSCQIMQKNVDLMAKIIFPEQEAKEDDKQKNIRELVADSNKSEKGQGKFMRNVFGTYFGKVDNIDKRAMLAAVFRNAKDVLSIKDSDESLVEEMRKSQDPKYKELFKGVIADPQTQGKMIYNLTEEDKAAITEYRAYKEKLRVQSNLLGGMLRGAGPLMHKMMQGLPTTNLPKEIKAALKDVKTNLPPIPEKVVQSEMLSLVESSGGKVTKIEVVKSLGAASVGQAFLCKVFGPAKDMKNGREVVIKLLRPEAKNRMSREEAIMLKAAQDTDEAMYLTYKGQLDNYKRELDLSIEAENCRQADRFYTGKFDDVKTMQVFDGIPATSTSLVIEKAPGVTLDSYIDELMGFKDQTLMEFYPKSEESDGSVSFRRMVLSDGSKETIEKMAAKKKILLDKINEAIVRRDHLVNLCHVWIDQAVMDQDSGFYHGDLHSGNIMINDEEATFIDYGNTVQLNKEQQKCIARMTMAASYSHVARASENSLKLFFDAFNALLEENNDPDFLALYDDAKKEELKEEFRKILAMGNSNESGFRICLCLIRAQELGIKLPPALQNYSQGQVRLQNTIDELNNAIKDLKEGVQLLDEGSGKYSVDPIEMILKRAKSMDFEEDGKEESMKDKFRRGMGGLFPIDEEAFKQELLDNTYSEADLSKGIKEVDKRGEFDGKYLNDYESLTDLSKEELVALGMSDEQLEKIKSVGEEFDVSEVDREELKTFRQRYQEFYDTWKDKKGTPEHKAAVQQAMISEGMLENYYDLMDTFGGHNTYVERITKFYEELDWSAAEQVLDIYEKQIPKALLFWAEVKELRKAQDEEASKEVLDQKAEDVLTRLKDVRSVGMKSNFVLSRLREIADVNGSENVIERQLDQCFLEEENGVGEKLRETFEAYKVFKVKYKTKDPDNHPPGFWQVGKEDEIAYLQAKEAFFDAYLEMAKVRLKNYYDKMYMEESNVKFLDFDNVQTSVVEKRFPMGSAGQIAMSSFKMGMWLGKETMGALMSIVGDIRGNG